MTIIRARDTRTGRVLHTDELVGLNQEYAAYHGALRRKLNTLELTPGRRSPTIRQIRYRIDDLNCRLTRITRRRRPIS